MRYVMLILMTDLAGAATTTVNVPARANGRFGAPEQGGTAMVLAIQLQTGDAYTLATCGTINLGGGAVADANGIMIPRSSIAGPFPQGYLPLEEGLIDAGFPYGDLPEDVEDAGALMAYFVPAAIASHPAFQAVDADVAANPAFALAPDELFHVGAPYATYVASEPGTLYLGINEPFVSNNSGSFEVLITLLSVTPGDLNCDGVVSVGDIGAFVLAITNREQYDIEFPDCTLINADVNEDGCVTVSDIGPFVGLLTGG